MTQRDPKVVIRDEDGNVVEPKEGQVGSIVRKGSIPPEGQLRITRSETALHSMYEIWVPDFMIAHAPAEVLGMLQSDRLDRVVLGLYEITKSAIALAGVAEMLEDEQVVPRADLLASTELVDDGWQL